MPSDEPELTPDAIRRALQVLHNGSYEQSTEQPELDDDEHRQATPSESLALDEAGEWQPVTPDVGETPYPPHTDDDVTPPTALQQFGVIHQQKALRQS